MMVISIPVGTATGSGNEFDVKDRVAPLCVGAMSIRFNLNDEVCEYVGLSELVKVWSR